MYEVTDTQGNSSKWLDTGIDDVLVEGFWQDVLPMSFEGIRGVADWYTAVIPVETSAEEGYNNYIRFYVKRLYRENFGWNNRD